MESSAVATAPQSTVDSHLDVRTLTAEFRALTSDALAPDEAPDAAVLPPSVSTTTLVHAVSQWENVRLAPKARQAVMFLLGEQEIGAVRPGGSVTVPLPTPICQTLMNGGSDASRRFQMSNLNLQIEMRTSADVRCAAFLLHLSHLYRAIIASRSLCTLAALQAELSQLHLPAPLLAHYDHAMEHKAAAFT
jgi:hypothetical protein